jgi:hypothetical protein
LTWPADSNCLSIGGDATERCTIAQRPGPAERQARGVTARYVRPWSTVRTDTRRPH